MSENTQSADDGGPTLGDAGLVDAQPVDDRPTTLGLDSGLDALRDSPAFCGPVEPMDHHCNDHLALIYENRDQQLSTAIPFLVQGLERGERCMYVTGDNTKAEVLAAIDAADVDVDADAAMESGALTFHTQYDTYLKSEPFDPGDMIDRYAEAIEAAEREGYEALRIVAETAWLMPDGVSLEDFMVYESRVNELFDDEDCIALCQYNREQLPPEIIRDIIRTHPHLVYDGAVCHNYYYTPPEEFFGPGRPAHEADRMLRTLRDRTQATVELRQHQRQLSARTTGSNRSPACSPTNSATPSRSPRCTSSRRPGATLRQSRRSSRRSTASRR